MNRDGLSHASRRSPAARWQAARRDQANRLVGNVLGHWGLGLIAHPLGIEIIDQLERAGYLRLSHR